MTDAPQLERVIEALLYLSPSPVSVSELVEATDATEAQIERALDGLSGSFCRRQPRPAAQERRGRMDARDGPGRRRRRAQAPLEAEDTAADPGAGRDARDRRLPPAGLPPRDQPHPRRRGRVRRDHADRARPDRGVRPLALRRDDLPHDRALRARLRPRRPRRPAGSRRLRPDPGGRGRAARPPAESGRSPRRPGRPSAPSRRSVPGSAGSPWSRPRRGCPPRADRACAPACAR